MTEPRGGAGPEVGGGPETEEGLETRLRRLEEIVATLEADDVELERALALFEEGVRHVRRAEAMLARAELRVDELLGEGGEGDTRPFDVAPDADDPDDPEGGGGRDDREGAP